MIKVTNTTNTVRPKPLWFMEAHSTLEEVKLCFVKSPLLYEIKL